MAPWFAEGWAQTSAACLASIRPLPNSRWDRAERAWRNSKPTSPTDGVALAMLDNERAGLVGSGVMA